MKVGCLLRCFPVIFFLLFLLSCFTWYSSSALVMRALSASARSGNLVTMAS